MAFGSIGGAMGGDRNFGGRDRDREQRENRGNEGGARGSTRSGARAGNNSRAERGGGVGGSNPKDQTREYSTAERGGGSRVGDHGGRGAEGGIGSRVIDALTRNPLRPPSGDDLGVFGTALGLMPGPIGPVAAVGGFLAGEARRAGIDVRNPSRPGPGDSQRGENRRGLLASGAAPDDDTPSPSVPEPSTPGDPSNLGARGRRRRLTDFNDSGASQRRLLSLG
ncbi:MAG TPA: hypothetical protein VFO41_13290 [Alphaproteobacteria bacterium]|nr:hypothetical protein [Alphaproteobacteria bacterium]